ncbi:MAG TPA: S16 family serine protease [Mycobacteriales bacterium]|nr:S16 family serine protease [Mycobacteriales bacterium]
MPRRTQALLVSVVAAVALFVVAWQLPVPYVALSPGPTFDTLGVQPGSQTPLIRIQGRPTYPTRGHLILLTVGVNGGPGDELNLFRAIAGWFNTKDLVLPEQFVFPAGQTPQQATHQQSQEMSQSQQDAMTAALYQLHVPGTVSIETVDPAQSASAVLQPGDEIVTVDNQPIHSIGDLLDVAKGLRVNRLVDMVVRRDGRIVRVGVNPTTESDTADYLPMLGFTPAETPLPPLKITIDLTNVGGPSAGTMFALGIIDKLTPGGINGGLTIAGTGAIGYKGDVLEIGGIKQKVFAALAAGATVFLAPTGECPDAASVAPPGLRVIPVATLSAALADLASLARGGPVPHC